MVAKIVVKGGKTDFVNIFEHPKLKISYFHQDRRTLEALQWPGFTITTIYIIDWMRDSCSILLAWHQNKEITVSIVYVGLFDMLELISDELIVEQDSTSLYKLLVNLAHYNETVQSLIWVNSLHSKKQKTSSVSTIGLRES